MIHYSIQGRGYPVVLIHGFPNDSSAWNPIKEKLAEQYQLILVDLPGVGESPVSHVPLSLQYMASEIKNVLDKENIAQAILVGHSMGGYTALQIAEEYPQYIKGISLVHSLASADSEERKENRRKSIVLFSKGTTGQEVFLRGMAENLFAPDFANAHPEMVHHIVAQGMKLSSAVLASFYNAIMQRSDKRHSLKQLSFPLQWIIGTEDTATPEKEALEQCYSAAINHVHIYEGCGHMSFYEMPKRLIKDLLSFFDFCVLS